MRLVRIQSWDEEYYDEVEQYSYGIGSLCYPNICMFTMKQITNKGVANIVHSTCEEALITFIDGEALHLRSAM